MRASALTDADSIIASPGLTWCELDDEAIILDLKAGSYYGLAGVGARVWALIQQPRRFCDIRDILFDEFDVESSACEADLVALLKDLHGRDLIEVRTS